MDATQWLLCLLSSVSWTPNAGRKDGRMLASVVIVVPSVLSSSLIDSCMFTLVLLTFHPPCESFCCLCESWPHFSLTSCFIWCNSLSLATFFTSFFCSFPHSECLIYFSSSPEPFPPCVYSVCVYALSCCVSSCCASCLILWGHHCAVSCCFYLR